MKILICLIVSVCVVNSSSKSNVTEIERQNSTVLIKKIDTNITDRVYLQPNCGGNVYPPDSRPPFYPNNPNYPAYPQKPNCPPNLNYPHYPNEPNYPQYPNQPNYPSYPQYPNYPQPPAYPQYPQYPTYPQIPPTYPQYPPDTPQFPPNYPQYPPTYPDRLPQCCSNIYNERHFYISSPGFPYSSNSPTDCMYILYKSDPNVCQLRLYFKFFWNGESGNSYDCNRGFLEIDGKRFCGCRTGLTVISRFGYSDQKVLRFKNEGYPKGNFNGFSIEVVQEMCNNRRYVKRYINSTRSGKEFKRRTDVNLSRRLETFDDEEMKPNVTVYFYGDPTSIGDIDLSGSPSTNVFNKNEPKDYLDTSSSSFFLQPVSDLICKKWTIIEWFALAGLSLFQRTGQCRRDQNSYPTLRPPISNNCNLMYGLTGSIQSPGYPTSYQGNLRICYRFQRSPGNCGVQLLMQDFDIEASNDCQKDYYMIGRYRYCGTALANRETLIDLSIKEYEDTYFISDSSPFHCGRGFRGTYRQISCENLPPPTSDRPSQTCGGVFHNPSFAIQHFPGIFAESRCDYIVYKTNPGVCGVLLSFVSFKLNCGYEYMLINNRRYCGELSGKIYKMDFIGNQMNLIYFKTNPLSKTGQFSIVGQQTEECNQFTLNVPAERLFINENETNANISFIQNVKKKDNVI